MRKIKKVIIGVGIILFELTSKVLGKDDVLGTFQAEYGVPPVTGGIPASILGVVEIILSCIFFIVGLVVIFNKKIATKVKIVIVSIMLILILIAIIAIMLEI